jgi:hypothetical protein
VTHLARLRSFFTSRPCPCHNRKWTPRQS